MQNTVRRNSLKKNFSWNFIGNLIYAATQWGLIIVMTRLGNVEMVGAFSLGLAITGPIIMFTNLQLRTVQATSEERYFEFSSFISVRIISNIVFSIALLIYLLFSDYDTYSLIIICLVAITKIVESLSDLTYGLFQQREKMELISKSTIMRGISSLITVSILIYFTNSLVIALLGMIICWVSVFLIYDIKNINNFSLQFKPSFNKTKIIQIIKMSIPLGIVVMIVSLNTNLPKIMIENMLGTEGLGYFASISYLVFVGSKFINSMGNAMLPRLANFYNEDKRREYIKYLLILVGISAIIGVLLVMISYFLGENILYFIYGSEFKEYKNLLILIMIYGMFNYISYSLVIGLNAMKSFKIQPYLSGIWLLVSLISLCYLVPDYGLIGAALSLIIYSITRVTTILLVLYINLRVNKN